MAYKDLSLKERHAIIKAGVANGIHRLSDIEARYDAFIADSVDYDMEAYARENPYGIFAHEGHYPDKFKKPNHPTFSDESIYHSEATPGGHWNGNTYEPSDYVLNQQGGWNNFLQRFQGQEQGTGAVPVFRGGVMLPEVEVRGHRFEEGGGIHIAPSKRGTFTAAATKHGKSVQEFASQVLAHKENYSPAMVRKANFARNSAKWHSTGGPLYPFSFSKQPLPVVRHANGGVLDWFRSILPQAMDSVELQRPVPQGLDYSKLKVRQAYTESGFDNDAKSNADAIGMFQITPDVLADYNAANNTVYTQNNLYDQDINTAVRDWYMEKLLNRPWVTKGGANDSIQYAKALAAFNYGPTNTLRALNNAKNAGINIYEGWDWLQQLPTETQDYINFILRDQNNSIHRSDTMFEVKKKLKSKEVEKLQ